MTRPVGERPGGSGTTRGWMRRPCRTQDPRSIAFSGEAASQQDNASDQIMPIDDGSVAAANAADIVAEGVEPANPAAAAIAVIIGIGIAGGDRGADDGGAEQARADAKAVVEAAMIEAAVMEAMGFGGRGGGSDAAGDGERGNGESGKFGLDRHKGLHPVECGPLWSACPIGRRIFDSGSRGSA